MTHTYLDETINFNIIYKKRKTMGIYIDVYGAIELRVPRDTSDEQVFKLLEKKWKWILLKVKEIKKRTSGHIEKTYTPGETFLYLGQSYPIKIIEDHEIEKDQVEFKDNQLNICVSLHNDEKIKQALHRFYYKQCKTLVEKRIRLYQPNFKVKPRGFRIANNKSNWGTCDSSFQLSFNWKLAMAPLDVIDYVVIHEMCHMVHLNHDRSFWRLVGKLMPDYEIKQQWLAQSSWKMIV